VRKIALPADLLRWWILVEIHELLVLKEDGSVEHFRVSDGDVAQAKLRASLCQRPGDSLVVVTQHAYIRSGSSSGADHATKGSMG
jgi:hypothetical protein